MSDEHTKYTDGSLIAVPVFFFFSPSSRITTEMTVIDNEQCWNIHAPKTPTIIIINNRKTFSLSTRLGFRFGQCSRHVRGRTIPFVPPHSCWLLAISSCLMPLVMDGLVNWTKRFSHVAQDLKMKTESKNTEREKKAIEPCAVKSALILNQRHKLNKWVHRRIYVFN